jgi:hypothetical protein
LTSRAVTLCLIQQTGDQLIGRDHIVIHQFHNR